MIPQAFGEYLLVSPVAERSMAEVFLAVRMGDRTGQLVVLKRPPVDEPPSGAVAEALRREIEVLREGAVEGIARLVDHGEVAGLPFVVLEHLKGVRLDTIVARGALDESAALLVGRDLARALAALHARGWIHGDVTPSNVLVDDAGEVTLFDLGIARRAGEAREMPAGTAGYASPEAAMGKAARASDDVYGWGVVVAECLLGARLYRERDLAEAVARRGDLPSRIGRIALVVSALDLDPAKRPSADALAREIQVGSEHRGALARAVLAGDKPAPENVERPQVSAAVPTGPMVATAADPILAKVSLRETERETGSKALSRKVVGLIAGVVLALAVILGFVLGRKTLRDTRPTTLILPPLPARAEVKLDGRSLLSVSPDRSIPIEPGSHKLWIKIAKREPKEYEFIAQPGDQIVIVAVPMPRAANKTDRNDKKTDEQPD